MFTPATSRHFTKWTDPKSGVVSYILTANITDGCQSFYFVNPCFTRNQRYLWFYAFCPPSPMRWLGLVDFETDEIWSLPCTQFEDASPYIDPDTGVAWWATGTELYRLYPYPDARPELINRIPDCVSLKRIPRRVSTHLTRSSDGRSMMLDPQFADRWYLVELPLDGSEPQIWAEFPHCINHAQFSPTDPNTVLFAEDFWRDDATGEMRPYHRRLWIAPRGRKPYPLYPGETPLHGHEWWDASGKRVFHVWYHHGVSAAPVTGVAETGGSLLWDCPRLLHASCDATAKHFVADWMIDHERVQGVIARNPQGGKPLDIVSEMIRPDISYRYHIHPHPAFCGDDNWISCTTLVRGRVDIALTPTAPLFT